MGTCNRQDKNMMCLIQKKVRTQHARGAKVFVSGLSSQNEFVDKENIQEPLGGSDHNQLHFNINIISDKTMFSCIRKCILFGTYRLE